MTILLMNFERTIKKGLFKKKSNISVFLIRFFTQENAAQDGADPAGNYRPRVWQVRQKFEGHRGRNSDTKIKKESISSNFMNFHDFSKNPILIYFLYLYFQTIMELLLKLTDGELKYGAGLNTSNTELVA